MVKKQLLTILMITLLAVFSYTEVHAEESITKQETLTQESDTPRIVYYGSKIASNGFYEIYTNDSQDYLGSGNLSSTLQDAISNPLVIESNGQAILLLLCHPSDLSKDEEIILYPGDVGSICFESQYLYVIVSGKPSETLLNQNDVLEQENPKEESDKTNIKEESDKTSVKEESDKANIKEESDKTSVKEESDKASVKEESDKTSVKEESDKTSTKKETDTISTKKEKSKPKLLKEYEHPSFLDASTDSFIVSTDDYGVLISGFSYCPPYQLHHPIVIDSAGHTITVTYIDTNGILFVTSEEYTETFTSGYSGLFHGIYLVIN